MLDGIGSGLRSSEELCLGDPTPSVPDAARWLRGAGQLQSALRLVNQHLQYFLALPELVYAVYCGACRLCDACFTVSCGTLGQCSVVIVQQA